MPDREGIVGYTPLFKYLPVNLSRLLRLRKIIRKVGINERFPRNARDPDSRLVDVGDLSFGTDGDQRVQAGLDEAPGVLRRLAQLFLRPLALSNIDTHLQDERGAVRVGEWEVENRVVTAVRTGPLPLMGRHGFENLKAITNLTGLAATKQMLKTAKAARLTEAFAEDHVGKGNPIIGR